jgi:hypothetical protein
MIYANLELDEHIRVEHNINNTLTPFTITMGQLEISLNEKEINHLDALISFAIQDYTRERQDR